MKAIVSAILSVCLAIGTKAQVSDNPMRTSTDSIVQTALSKFMQDSARVMVSVGIYKNGKTFIYNYGKKDKGDKNTIYEIGSISKTFTGTLLAQAVAEKKVQLEDDVRKYLGPGYEHLEYEGHPIQLKHLLYHVSGLPFLLPDKGDVFQYPEDSVPNIITRMQENYSKQAFLKDLQQVKLDTIPGFKFKYSNAATQLLGFILEQIYGMSYEQLVKKYITGPLNMAHTTAIFPDRKQGLTRGHNGKGNIMPYNPPLMAAAGGLYSSVDDMLKYIGYQVNESNPVVALTHQPQWGDIKSFAFGLNWHMVVSPNGFRKIWQSGGTFGYSSYCMFYPELGTGIVMLSNESDRTAQEGLGLAVIAIFEGIQ
ncbi:beta-lactamase family protein [Chitinophaga filiformis]|uniref:serine hydrolase domain-containing protein n=1 Tax=Chitinophaga filiformis TaxID=104663 RepID=UPI001F3EEA4C|nr:serine hydrolase domain-containing protein [Chitinophaga filiformis]MCF6403067.1 beta-lactamase family protein [Chitinophaga filiformis]